MNTTTTTTLTEEAEFIAWLYEQVAAFENGSIDPATLAALNENVPDWNYEALIRLRSAEIESAWFAGGWDGAEPTAKPIPSLEGIGRLTLLEYASALALRLEELAPDEDIIAEVAGNREAVTGAFAAGAEPFALANHLLSLLD